MVVVGGLWLGMQFRSESKLEAAVGTWVGVRTRTRS